MRHFARGSKISIWTSESWALLGILAAIVVALMFLLITIGSRQPLARAIEEARAASADEGNRLTELRELVEWGNEGLVEWSMLIIELCSDPELLTRRIHVSCENGTLTLSEDSFFEPDGINLSSQGRELLREAVPIYLDHLRDNAWLWQNVESIEVRGHSDTFARRDPYRVNLLSSQRRALGVLQFLTSDPGIPELDRNDLMRIATVSGASFSRPPRDCPTREVRCRKVWRRVEIRINLAEERTRADFMAYLERIRELLDPVETD